MDGQVPQLQQPQGQQPDPQQEDADLDNALMEANSKLHQLEQSSDNPPLFSENPDTGEGVINLNNEAIAGPKQEGESNLFNDIVTGTAAGISNAGVEAGAHLFNAASLADKALFGGEGQQIDVVPQRESSSLSYGIPEALGRIGTSFGLATQFLGNIPGFGSLGLAAKGAIASPLAAAAGSDRDEGNLANFLKSMSDMEINAFGVKTGLGWLDNSITRALEAKPSDLDSVAALKEALIDSGLGAAASVTVAGAMKAASTFRLLRKTLGDNEAGRLMVDVLKAKEMTNAQALDNIFVNEKPGFKVNAEGQIETGLQAEATVGQRIDTSLGVNQPPKSAAESAQTLAKPTGAANINEVMGINNTPKSAASSSQVFNPNLNNALGVSNPKSASESANTLLNQPGRTQIDATLGIDGQPKSAADSAGVFQRDELLGIKTEAKSAEQSAKVFEKAAAAEADFFDTLDEIDKRGLTIQPSANQIDDVKDRLSQRYLELNNEIATANKNPAKANTKAKLEVEQHQIQRQLDDLEDIKAKYHKTKSAYERAFKGEDLGDVGPDTIPLKPVDEVSAELEHLTTNPKKFSVKRFQKASQELSEEEFTHMVERLPEEAKAKLKQRLGCN